MKELEIETAIKENEKIQNEKKKKIQEKVTLRSHYLVGGTAAQGGRAAKRKRKTRKRA